MVTWDASFEAAPADLDEAKYGATKIRELKLAISERLELEHNFKAGTQPQHKAGLTPIVYIGTTTQINALTGMQTGCLAYDTTLSRWKYYSGSNWTETADHGALSGLSDDDHSQYLNLTKASQNIAEDITVTATKTIDGRDISADGIKLDAMYSIVGNYEKPVWPENKLTYVSTSSFSVAAGTTYGVLDSTRAYNLKLASAMTKLTGSAWAVGSGSGGRFFGTGVGANSLYYIFLIRKTSDGTIDCGFDTAINCPNIPTGYSAYKYVGAFATDSSAYIRNFEQDRNLFKFIGLYYQCGRGNLHGYNIRSYGGMTYGQETVTCVAPQESLGLINIYADYYWQAGITNSMWGRIEPTASGQTASAITVSNATFGADVGSGHKRIKMPDSPYVCNFMVRIPDSISANDFVGDGIVDQWWLYCQLPLGSSKQFYHRWYRYSNSYWTVGMTLNGWIDTYLDGYQ